MFFVHTLYVSSTHTLYTGCKYPLYTHCIHTPNTVHMLYTIYTVHTLYTFCAYTVQTRYKFYTCCTHGTLLTNCTHTIHPVYTCCTHLLYGLTGMHSMVHHSRSSCWNDILLKQKQEVLNLHSSHSDTLLCHQIELIARGKFFGNLSPSH